MNTRDEGSNDPERPEPWVQSGPRRSTWKPPTGPIEEPQTFGTLPRPELLSSTDEEVLRDTENSTTLESIQRLQHELELRSLDKQRFREWEAATLATGSPEAIAEVEAARHDFRYVLGKGANESPRHETETAEELTSIAEGNFTVDSDAWKVADGPPPLVEPTQTTGPIDFDQILANVTVPVDFSVETAASSEPQSSGQADPASSVDNEVSAAASESVTLGAVHESPTTTATGATPHLAVASTIVAAKDKAIDPLIESPQAPADSQRDDSRPDWLEIAAVEPTPIEQRMGKAVRLFWLWFAPNANILAIVLGVVIFAFGMSLRQAVVAVLVGIALSMVPLGFTALASKRSGMPTMVVSRAVFGLRGNILPSVIAIVTRLFWAALLLWSIAWGLTQFFQAADFGNGLNQTLLTILFLVTGAILAIFMAAIGYRIISHLGLVVTLVSTIAVAGFIALTWHRVDFETALAVADGPWTMIVLGAVSVFSFFGLAWANSGGDVARYQRYSSSGASSMLWSALGIALPAFVLVAYGAVLAASDPLLAGGLISRPFATLFELLPSWYLVPLAGSIGLSLLVGAVYSIYSGSFALHASGISTPRWVSVLIAGTIAAVVAGTAILFSIDVGEVLLDTVITLAVPVAAWVGLFAAELMIRTQRFHTPSLLRVGGVYPTVRWANVSGLVIAMVLGFGLTSATAAGLSWQGYLFQLIEVPLESSLAHSNVGVLVAFLTGLIVPLLFGVRAIRRQQEQDPEGELLSSTGSLSPLSAP